MLKIQVVLTLSDGQEMNFQPMPEDYFWQSQYGDNSSFEPMSATIHDNPRDLVPSGLKEKVVALTTEVKDVATSETFKCSYTFWKGLENYVCISKQEVGGQVSRELVFVGDFPFKEEAYQVIRIDLGDENGSLKMNHVGWYDGEKERGFNIKTGEEGA